MLTYIDTACVYVCISSILPLRKNLLGLKRQANIYFVLLFKPFKFSEKPKVQPNINKNICLNIVKKTRQETNKTDLEIIPYYENYPKPGSLKEWNRGSDSQFGIG